MRHIIIYLAVGFLLVSCSSEEVSSVLQGQDYPVRFRLTKGADDYRNVSYRMMFFKPGGSYITSGTYCGKKYQDWLEPCSVDENTGAWMADGHQFAARINSEDHYLAVVTPAVAIEQLTLVNQNTLSDVSDQRGIRVYRNPSDDPRAAIDTIRCSESFPFLNNGMYENNEFVCDLSEKSELLERRATILVEIQCGEDIPSIKVQSAKMISLINKGFYRPSADHIEYLTNDLCEEQIFDFISSGGHVVTSLDTVKSETPLNILPIDYSRRDAYDNPKEVFPYLMCFLGDDGGAVYRIPVNFEIKPQYHYLFHLVINSLYVKLFVSMNDWEDGGTHTVSPEFAEYTFPVATVLAPGSRTDNSQDIEI